MTETLAAPTRLRGVTIRAYRPSDHNACRRLWAELTEHRHRLFDEPMADQTDAGAGFEEYLTQLNLSGMWVAEETEAGVAGFVGLMLEGRTGEVEPVIVTRKLRGRGIGRGLLARVAEEAQRRGLKRLTISPPARDLAALRSLHAAGFGTIATVTLSHDIGTRRGGAPRRESTLDLFDLRFGV